VAQNQEDQRCGSSKKRRIGEKMKKILMIVCAILLFSCGCSGLNAAKTRASAEQTHCDSSMPDFSTAEQASTVSGSGCVPVDPTEVPGVSEPDVPSSFEASKESGSAVASTEPILTGKPTGSGMQKNQVGKDSHKAPTDPDPHRMPAKSKPGEALTKPGSQRMPDKSKPLMPPDTTKQTAAAVDTAVKEARCELTTVLQDNSKTLMRYVSAKDAQ
jgi:cytoskeletal protein RodZ